MDALARHVCQVYRPRNPRKSPLYHCVVRHVDELRAAGKIRRPVEAQVLERFRDCGDLHKGFARIHCDDCGHDYLLAFSCKTRCFCPACHQKRMLVYGEWVQEEILAPVPHRQYVFTLPKLLRPYFHHRPYLGKLCRIAGILLKQNYHEILPDGKPGFITFVQTFGDLVTFNPHIHVLCADGIFKDNGVFRVLPPPPAELLVEQFRLAVLNFLYKEGLIAEDFKQRLLSWAHSGFSVHHDVKVKAKDIEGRQQLARYMVRAPFSLEKTEYKADSGMVVYRSKMHQSLKRNYQIIPGVQWLALLLQHVPDKGEHLVRYYGWYSNRRRGMRRQQEEYDQPEVMVNEAPADPDFARAARAAWARLIQKVYEVDPLACPRCGEVMRVMALIEDPPVIEKLLKHLHLWDPRPPGPAPPAVDLGWPRHSQIPLTYAPLPDIA